MRHMKQYHTSKKSYGCSKCGKKYNIETFYNLHESKCGNNQHLINDDDGDGDIQIPSMVEITIQSNNHRISVFDQELSSTIGLEQINVFQQSARNSTTETSVLQDFQHSDEEVLMDQYQNFRVESILDHTFSSNVASDSMTTPKQRLCTTLSDSLYNSSYS